MATPKPIKVILPAFGKATGAVVVGALGVATGSVSLSFGEILEVLVCFFSSKSV